MIGALFLLLSIYFFFTPSKRWLSAFFVFCLLTAGFQFVPINLMILPAAGITKTYDWVLLYFIVVLFMKPSVYLSPMLWKEFRNVKWFIILLFFLCFYSIYIEKVEVSVTIRVFRNFIFVISLFAFSALKRYEMVRVLKWMVIFTSIGSILYCLQTVVGLSLLNNVTDDYNPSALDLQFNNGIARYYNLPVYVVPVLFLLLFDRIVISSDLRIAMIVPNIGAIILSQHRNLLIAVIVCCMIYYIISKNMKFGKIALILCASFALLAGADNLMGNRLSEGVSDVEEIFTNGLTDQELMVADLADMSTSEFRFYLLYERWNYVTRDIQHTLFGIGLLTEDSYKVRSLNFNVGGTLDDTGRIAQVDTSDIAWSPLIINFGIAGTLIFLSMYTSILKKFYAFRNSKIMLVGILYIVSLFFTSFYSILIMAQSTICFVMLLAAYQFRMKTQAAAAALKNASLIL